jgi:hypothetical protein
MPLFLIGNAFDRDLRSAIIANGLTIVDISPTFGAQVVRPFKEAFTMGGGICPDSQPTGRIHTGKGPEGLSETAVVDDRDTEAVCARDCHRQQ